MIHGGDIYSNKIQYDFSVNINPLGCPETVIKAVKDGIRRMNHYPDPEQRRARHGLSSLEGVVPENIICGNGASELIMAVVRAVNPKNALLVSPGFFGYQHALNVIQGCQISEFFLKEENDFKLTEDILDYITDKTDILFLTNPNNPTGKNIDSDLLERILEKCESCKCTVLLDECFLRLSNRMFDYISDSSGDRSYSYKKKVSEYSNLYVVDAFTKLFACPGIRAGYLVSSADNIDSVRRQLPEWNLSIPSEEMLVTGAEVLMNSDYLEKSLKMIREEREYLIEEFGIISNCRIVNSDTNFFVVQMNINSSELCMNQKLYIFSELLKQSILIRDCSNFSGLGEGWFRIAVKGHEENMLLVNTIKKVKR
ncbi:MAG: aminotransferase class I/II-fold pyridoxal phosphate-dependent enzyme [Eubacterium sp.]|nr:aminotransferase class I/II-fold pyridoxal phosphate-dependent enzyme [Eubacterium sp.]